MSIQITVSADIDAKVDGLIEQKIYAVTGIVETSAGIAPGKVVSRGSGANGVVVGGSAPLGVLGRSLDHEGVRTTNELTYLRYGSAPVVRIGTLWAPIAHTGSAGARLCYNSTTGVIDIGPAGAGEIDLPGYELLTAVMSNGALGLVLCNTQTGSDEYDQTTALQIKKAELAIDHGDLDAEATHQEFDFAAALPGEAYVIGAYLDIDEEFDGSRDRIDAERAFDNAGPYNLAAADTMVLDTDGDGSETITFDAAAGSITDTTSYPCADQDGLTALVTVDDTHGDGQQTVTFAGATTTASAVQTQMSAQLTGCVVSVDTGQVKIVSNRKGLWSSVACAAGTGGLTWAAPVAGTGDVNDIDAVTEAEVKTRIEADSIATLDITGDTPVIASPTQGAGGSLDFKSGNCLAIFGLDVELVEGADAIDGALTADLGIKSGDTDALLDGANITSATGKINGPKGAAPSGHFGGGTVQLRLDANLNMTEISTGELTAVVLYHDLAEI